jgi:hypothetical protein
MRGSRRGIGRPHGGLSERSNRSCKRPRPVCYVATRRGQPHGVNPAHGKLVAARGVAAAPARVGGRAAWMRLRALVTHARWFLHYFGCCRTLLKLSRTRRCPPAAVLGALAPRSGVVLFSVTVRMSSGHTGRVGGALTVRAHGSHAQKPTVEEPNLHLSRCSTKFTG